MKETWNYYEHLRRWGLFLLVGMVIGGLAGIGLFFQKDRAAKFQAAATISVPGPKILTFTVLSGEGFKDPDDATQTLRTTADKLSERTNSDVEILDIIISGRSVFPLWKAIILGGVVGGLMSIGVAYVWDDARAYQRYRQGSSTTER